MKGSDEQRKAKVRERDTSGAIHVRSAEGRGIGRSAFGAKDAKALAQESVQRALRITGK